jgi:CheY-like chemotaxis protein
MEVAMKGKILLVEDNEKQRLLYREELEQAGYVVDIALDGDNALIKVEKDRPDLIVLDIELPNRDGIETMKKLLEDFPDLPVILNSAYAHYKSNFISWGAQAYLIKSSDTSKLINEVDRVISEHNGGKAPISEKES